MVAVGQSAPDFTLRQRDGTSLTLSQYKGKKNVVLSFHVYSFTDG